MRVLLLQSAPLTAPDGSARTDQFAGVAAALAERGIDADRALAEGPPPTLPEGTGLVAVADCLSPACRHALRLAHRAGLPALLMMDGLIEHRNTFDNPRVGERFLNPAPVHAVACAGPTCADVLTELGNDAWATGLPRLDAITPIERTLGHTPRRLLVATANTPWFSEPERGAIVRALGTIRDRAHSMGVEVLWRLTGRLELMLGVTNDTRPLREALADTGAVLTTPSTLMTESMLAGVPTGLIDAFSAPVWHTPAWVWNAHATDAEAGLDRTIAAMLDANAQDMERQRAALAAIHPEDGRSAERVAEVIADLAHDPPRDAAPAIVPLTRPAPERLPVPGRPRVVNVVWSDGPPNGGVPVWCARMTRRFRERSMSYDAVTLHLSPVGFELDAAERDTAEICVISPDLDHSERIRVALDALLALDPAIAIAHHADLPGMIATAAKFRGVRTVAALHADDASAEGTLRAYDTFDGAVAVSEACARRLAPIAGDRPTSTIPCGVPILDRPRTPRPGGPLRLAYVGRMVELQKRISDLARLSDELEAHAVACELHLVGDGPDLDRLLTTLRGRPFAHVCVVAHGFRSAHWVERFLEQIDISVLVSEFEGASITMMEAMGAGVVPCVTDVGSGVRELVRDGVTGVVVPIGDMPAMGARIAHLATNRDELARMGAAAWGTARKRTGLDDACDAWAGLFDRVMARDPLTAPTDAHLRPTDAYRWTKHWGDDPAHATEFLRDELAAAGYGHVAVVPVGSEIDPRADAVVLEGQVTPELADRAEVLRARSIGVAFSPTLTEPEWARLARAVQRLTDAGASRVAIFGAGDHTRRAARAFELGLPIVGIIDDRPPAPTLFGIPVVPAADALTKLRPDAVVLSSDAWEPALWARSAPLRAAGVRVEPIYHTYADTPHAASAR